jgi:hypothetical protein
MIYSYFIKDCHWSILFASQIDGRAWRFGQQEEVHIYHLLALDTTDIFMFNHSNEKTTMMNALVKEGKDLVLEALLKPRNEEIDDEEEEEIDQLADEEIDASNDADLIGPTAKSKKPAPKVKAKSKAQANVNEGAGDEEGSTDRPKKSRARPSTKKTVASSSKTSKRAAKPIEIDLDDDEPDIPLAKVTARGIVIDLDGDEDTSTGKGKQKAGSSGHAKRKAAQLGPDEEDTSAEGIKRVERELPPPSKKTKKTVELTRMETLGAAWREKNRAAASATASSSGSVSPSGK